MAYQISYFLGESGFRTRDADVIADAALATYPVPQWPEWAEAHDPTTNTRLYGHHGGWHAYPPVEVEQHERRKLAERAAAETERTIKALPHTVVESADASHVTLTIDGECRTLTTEELSAATSDTNGDRAARRYYRAIETAARAAKQSHARVLVRP